MQLDRRSFMVGLAAAGTTTALAPAVLAASKTDLNALYDKSIVIDTLSFAHAWDEEEYKAVERSGYTGIITSLNRSSLKVALDQLLEWHQRVEEHPERYMFALKTDDFLEAKKTGRLAVMMNFQNATMLEGDVDNIDILYEMGMRCFQLTYNSRNLVGDGSTERTNAGLSDFGVAVVERMNKLGILVDVSHSGKQTTLDAIEVSQKPIAFTHTMCESLRPGHPRAKEDAALKKLADNGGVAGIAALGYFLGKNPGTDTTIETYVDHIDHAVKLMGIPGFPGWTNPSAFAMFCPSWTNGDIPPATWKSCLARTGCGFSGRPWADERTLRGKDQLTTFIGFSLTERLKISGRA